MEYERITAFQDLRFQTMFQAYFGEMGVPVKDWLPLFREMDEDGRENEAILALDGGKAVGFIQYCPLALSGWFFTCQAGFVREFWVMPDVRCRGVGTALLRQAENRFRECGAGWSMLTTDSAEQFYLARGYAWSSAWQARNGDKVYIKDLAASDCGGCGQ